MAFLHLDLQLTKKKKKKSKITHSFGGAGCCSLPQSSTPLFLLPFIIIFEICVYIYFVSRQSAGTVNNKESKLTNKTQWWCRRIQAAAHFMLMAALGRNWTSSIDLMSPVKRMYALFYIIFLDSMNEMAHVSECVRTRSAVAITSNHEITY